MFEGIHGEGSPLCVNVLCLIGEYILKSFFLGTNYVFCVLLWISVRLGAIKKFIIISCGKTYCNSFAIVPKSGCLRRAIMPNFKTYTHVIMVRERGINHKTAFLNILITPSMIK